MLQFLVFFLFAIYSAQDCAFRGRSKLIDHRTYVACSESVAYNPTVATKTLDTLEKTMPSYAFIDAVKDSPINGFQNFQIDIIDELEEIRNTIYDNNDDFQQDVSDVFLRLKDPHTLYTKPRECYSVFAVQPLALNSAVNRAGKQIIYISGAFSLFMNDPLYSHVPFQDLMGAEVRYIDDQPALDNIADFAKNFMYISKDTGTMFNSALGGGYQQRPLVLMPTPLGPTQHIEVRYANGTFGSLHLPWGFFFVRNTNYTRNGCVNTFDSTNNDNQNFYSRKFVDEVHNDNLMRTTNKKLNSRHHKKTTTTLLNEFHLPEMKHIETFSPLKEHKYKRSEEQQKPDISIINVSSDVIVLQITTFSPDDDRSFLKVVGDVMKLGAAGSIPYLILDVRGNGGGSICLGYQVITSLISERNPIGHYDIKENALFDLLVNAASPSTPLVGSQSWTDENGNPYQNKSWYTPPQYHMRGGVNGTYSSPSYLSCNYNMPPPSYLFKKILVLSDGLCGSTCAVFVSHLNEIDSVDTVTLGGILNQPQQSFSFPGGLVLSYDILQRLSNSLGISSPLVPSLFPNSAGVRFAWLEIYPWRESDPSNVPLEFLFIPSDFRLPLWVSVDAPASQQATVYQAVSQLFINPPPTNSRVSKSKFNFNKFKLA